VNGAGFVRFLYGAPTASLLLILSLQITGAPLPEANWRFVAFCAAGGIAQILATNLLIMAFGYRNFAVGTAYGKTETVQSAVIAFIFLHEVLSGLAWIIIFIEMAFYALPGPSLVVRTMFGLVVTNTLQILMQGSFLLLREPGPLTKAFSTWLISM
jgi:hypothetical protein